MRRTPPTTVSACRRSRFCPSRPCRTIRVSPRSREDIGSALARIKFLSVNAAAYEAVRDGACGVSEAGERFGLRYLLQGSVDADDSDVRIRLRLTDTSDGSKIWSEKYAHALPANFALQDEIALEVAAAIGPMIERNEARRAAQSRTDLLGAYELYVRGYAKVFAYDEAEMLAGLVLIEEAIELAPDFGQAIMAAGVTYHDLFTFGWGGDQETIRLRAIELLERALRASPDDAEVLASVGICLPILTGNIGRGSALTQRALRANPSSATAWFGSGWIKACLGDLAGTCEDMAMAGQVANTGPLATHAGMALGNARAAQGSLVEGIEIMQEAGHPGPLADIALAACCAEAGHDSEALAAFERYAAWRARPAADFRALLPEKARVLVPLDALERLVRERRPDLLPSVRAEPPPAAAE